jgi:hypothetical protein
MTAILRVLLLSITLAAVSACGKQGSKMVYVLEEPQTVTLVASAAPQSVPRGEAVVLHAERKSIAKWKQVPMDQVKPGQCWVYQPPESFEREVADSIEWEVEPNGSVLFRPEYRMDHARVITTDRRGKIKLIPKTTVKCEADRVVEGEPIQIDVTPF